MEGRDRLHFLSVARLIGFSLIVSVEPVSSEKQAQKPPQNIYCPLDGVEPFERISEKITQATNLTEAVFWHQAMAEQLELQAMALHIADDRSAMIIIVREKQRLHRHAIERIRHLIAMGDDLTWPCVVQDQNQDERGRLACELLANRTRTSSTARQRPVRGTKSYR